MLGSQLQLSWDSYQNSICKGLGLLQQKGEFVDMTIAADGHHVKVHQMILSLISPFIKNLIASAQCPHPVIFLNKVSHEVLGFILEYAYTGEVLVTRDKLDEFLDACRSLHIKGLETDSIRGVGEFHVNENMNTTAASEHSYNQKEPDTKVFASKSVQPAIIQEPETAVRSGVKRKRVETPTLDNNETSYEDEDIKDDSHMDNDFNDDNDSSTMIHRTVLEPGKKSIAKQKTSTPSSQIHYSVSCQGSIQMVLNRFLYYLRHTKKNDDRLWRCKDYFKKACPAYVRTNGDIVVERGCSHNHVFHDKQILKRVKDGNMFTGFNTVEIMALVNKHKGSASPKVEIQYDDDDDDNENK